MTNTTTNNNTIATTLAALAAVIGGRAWGADKGKHRVYFDTGRRDATCYVEFPDADADGLHGGRLRVFVEAGRQPVKWAAGQKRLVVDTFTRAAHAAMAFSDAELDGQPLADCLAAATAVMDADDELPVADLV